jgi:glycosyltransferase involved in cell wall biosynthesis
VISVVFVCPNLQSGGAERHWSILLPRLAERGFDVRLLTLDGRGPFFDAIEASGIPAACLGLRSRPVQGFLRAVRELLRTRTDVVVSRATSAHALASVAEILRVILPHANAVFAVSNSQLPDLASLGVQPTAITVIPNGTDFYSRPDRRTATRSAIGAGETDVVALLVGRLEQQKRVDLFLDALDAAQRHVPQLVGVVAGTGPYAASLAALADSRGTRVHFLGDRQDMPSVFAAADVLCLTSDTEAAPFVALEGMASGLPVVATRVGSLPDVIIDSETGVLLDIGSSGPIANALVRLSTEGALRRTMGAAAKERQATLFTADVMTDRYADALLSLVAAKR